MMIRSILLALASLIVHAHASPANDDVLILKNGDRMTGEIKKLAGGDIHFDTDYAESVFIIDWSEVERVESSEHYVFETSAGARMTGSLKTLEDDTDTIVITEDTGGLRRVTQNELVSIEPVETSFVGRLDLALDFGYSFTKANSTRQLSLRSTVNYTEENWTVGGGFDTLENVVDDGTDTRRSNVNAHYRRFIGRRWFGLGAINLLRSDEQELDLRSTLSWGAGRYLRRTQEFHVVTSFGLAWTNELYQDPEIPRTDSAESFGAFELNAFDIGDVNLKTRLVVLPSLTDWGRVRIDYDLDTSWEIVDDLFFRVGYFQNYDSNPPDPTLPKSDYGITTSVGWSL